ncbi:Reverse transcriptase/retrotransposon-derived protein [Theobroma cacao]|nr:Reverse transcriptase/retrotransposon-derived protein [Theobroma cacao]
MLKEHKLYANFSKCEFWLNNVSFLSHIVSKDGVMVDRNKIEAVKKWPSPTLVIEIRSFQRLVKHYKKFVKDFSNIVAPMTKLTQKGVHFIRTNACKESFEKLKSLLTKTPMLSLPCGSEGYTICFHASRVGLGLVLMQHGKETQDKDEFVAKVLKDPQATYGQMLTRELGAHLYGLCDKTTSYK